jgi:hypothetical protein
MKLTRIGSLFCSAVTGRVESAISGAEAANIARRDAVAPRKAARIEAEKELVVSKEHARTQQKLAQYELKIRGKTAKQLQKEVSELKSQQAQRFLSAGGVAYQRPGGGTQLYLGGATTRPQGLRTISDHTSMSTPIQHQEEE